jgi:hypothetical protein
MKNKLGYIDVPTDYFTLQKEDKDVVCNSILEAMLYVLEKNISKKVDQKKLLLDIIDSSIVINEIDENYETAGVLLDIRKMIND